MRFRPQVLPPLLWVEVPSSSLGLFHTHVYSLELSLRILWVHSQRLRIPFSSCLSSKFSSFMPLLPGAPLPGSSDQKDGSSFQSTVCTISTAPCLCLTLRTVLPGKQQGQSSLLSFLQVLTFHHSLSFFTFQKPQVVAFCVLTSSSF